MRLRPDPFAFFLLPSSSRLKEKSGSLKKTEKRLQALRQEVQQLKADLAKSQSINFMLHKENEVLKARLEMKKSVATELL